MKLVPLHTLFNIRYGNSFELINLERTSKSDSNSINYVSRTEKNNGISAIVKKNDEFTANPANTISVAVSGSVLSSFLQSEPYYTGFHIYVLSPIKEMTKVELLFYCNCIRANKYKYNYGRQANRTLKDILVPNALPPEFATIQIADITPPNANPISKAKIDLFSSEWEEFELSTMFEVKKGKRLTKEDMEPGNTPFIAAIDSNNGWRDYVSKPAIHDGNTITVNYNGSVAEAFYQPVPFWASDDVNVLYPKFKMSVFVGMFIATIIRKEKYRFNFGRKWHKERMEKSSINLPSKDGKPDYQFMEKFIKSLPYSSSLETQKSTVAKHSKSNVGNAPQKGLSDDELIKKYESGAIELGKKLKKAIDKN